MDAVVVATQEKAFKIAALLQLKKGQNKSMWTKLLTVEVVVVGMGYTLVAVDTGLDYLGRKKGRKQQRVWHYSVSYCCCLFFPVQSTTERNRTSVSYPIGKLERQDAILGKIITHSKGI